jgi:hypothetical protein
VPEKEFFNSILEFCTYRRNGGEDRIGSRADDHALSRASPAVPWKADILPDVQNLSRLCENSDAKPSNPIFAQFWPVLSDQKPANRENSL